MHLEQEHYSESLRRELLPHLQANWRESPSYEPGIEADPDWERYKLLDEAGAVLCVTCRNDADMLLGYIIVLAFRSMHHRTIYCAQGDAFYVLPEHRHHAAALYRHAEDLLVQGGVTRIGWPVVFNSPLHELLVSLGFVEDEMLLEKRL